MLVVARTLRPLVEDKFDKVKLCNQSNVWFEDSGATCDQLYMKADLRIRTAPALKTQGTFSDIPWGGS